MPEFSTSNLTLWPDHADDRSLLEQAVLPRYLQTCRWYRAKSKKIESVKLEAFAQVPENNAVFCLLLVNTEGVIEHYVLPLALVPQKNATSIPSSAILAIIPIKFDSEAWVLIDACHLQSFRSILMQLVLGKKRLECGLGFLQGKPSGASNITNEPDNSKMLATEQSNSAMTYSSGSFLKLYRKVEEGLHPEPEVLRFLREKTTFRGVPEFQSMLEWEKPGSPPMAIALLQSAVIAENNGWEWAVQNFGKRNFTEWIEFLAQQTAELHMALGSQNSPAEFASEALRAKDLEAFAAAAQNRWQQCAASLSGNANILSRSTIIEKGLHPEGFSGFGKKIRIHGDYHLGQILCGNPAIWILDFEGEVSRPLHERRQKFSPLRDVAGMLRSFHYAQFVSKQEGNVMAGGLQEYQALCQRFLHRYYSIMDSGSLLPEEKISRDALLQFFMLEKAVYELDYEINNRPDWISIPLAGLLALTD